MLEPKRRTTKSVRASARTSGSHRRRGFISCPCTSSGVGRGKFERHVFQKIAVRRIGKSNCQGIYCVAAFIAQWFPTTCRCRFLQKQVAMSLIVVVSLRWVRDNPVAEKSWAHDLPEEGRPSASCSDVLRLRVVGLDQSCQALWFRFVYRSLAVLHNASGV